MASEPTDKELIAFADSILAKLGESLRHGDLLHETVTHNRELWLLLYDLNRNPEEGEPGSS